MSGIELQLAGAGFFTLAGLKDSAATGLMLTATLVLLNLPRISTWIADRWKACRVSRSERE
jgi:hypothetical protein